MRNLFAILVVILSSLGIASAQTEGDLKRYFEGRHVTLKIDMPATKDGVNIYPERAQSLNYSDYATRLKQHGTAIRHGESVMITKIKVKGKHIEFQFGGGGYGTAGDETGASVYVPSASKSRREKNLEEELKRVTDPQRKKQIKEDLDDLRRSREREDRRNQAIAAEAAEARRARIEQKALQGGSRFNIHYSLIDTSVLTPEALIEALKKYADFSTIKDGDEVSFFRQTSYRQENRSSSGRSILRVGPSTTYLKNGLSMHEVEMLLGKPARILERQEGDSRVTSYVFPRSGGRVLIAEFINGVLVRSWTDTLRDVAQVDTGR